MSTPTPLTKILSVRFDATRSLASWIEFLESVARRHELVARAPRSRRVRLFAPEHLRALESGRGPAGEFDALAIEGAPPLSPEKVRVLTRTLEIATIGHSGASGDPLLEIEYAPEGRFPCLGGWLWWKEELQLPDGFVRVQGVDRCLVSTLHGELRAWGG